MSDMDDWLSQRQKSQLFDKDSDTISLQLRSIFREGELSEAVTTEESSVVQKEAWRSVSVPRFSSGSSSATAFSSTSMKRREQ